MGIVFIVYRKKLYTSHIKNNRRRAQCRLSLYSYFWGEAGFWRLHRVIQLHSQIYALRIHMLIPTSPSSFLQLVLYLSQPNLGGGGLPRCYGLINYIGTKTKCRHLRKFTWKGSLRPMFVCLRYTPLLWLHTPPLCTLCTCILLCREGFLFLPCNN